MIFGFFVPLWFGFRCSSVVWVTFDMRKLALLALVALAIGPGVEALQTVDRERLHGLNNLGVALMEQYRPSDAAEQFAAALVLDPKFFHARANLALAFYYQRRADDALREARAALALEPDSPHMHYLLGAVLQDKGDLAAARAAFEKVAAFDSKDAPTLIHLAQIAAQGGKFADAVALYRKALAAEPYNATAAYGLATALTRSGDRAAGQKALAEFQRLRATGTATTLGVLYFEQGRYAEAVSARGNEPGIASAATPPVKFAIAPLARGPRFAPCPPAGVDAKTFRTRLAAELSTGGALVDVDDDADLDLFAVDASKGRNTLWLNDGKGAFTDATERAKLPAGPPAAGVVFGDYDNDGKTDAFVFGDGPSQLLHREPDNTFRDVAATAGVAGDGFAATAAFVDYDHDGDLDLVVGRPSNLEHPRPELPKSVRGWAPGRSSVYRNDGGKFADVTDAFGLGAPAHVTSIVPTDFDNRRDVDLFLGVFGGVPRLLANQRDGTFRDVAAVVGIDEPNFAYGVGAGDINKDGFVDFVTGRDDGALTLYESDGRGAFAKRRLQTGQSFVAHAQVLDYDNDGLLDVLARGERITLLRNTGRDFVDVTKDAALGAVAACAPAWLAGDLDLDGDTDFLSAAADGAAVIARGEGASGNRWYGLRLAGKTSNRSGIGSKVVLRSGSLTQLLDVYAASPMPAAYDLRFGLGRRTSVDTVRVLWPAGIVQAEVTAKAGASDRLEELDRKGTSCPLLYAWNGERFDFVTDFLGGSAVGFYTPSGKWNYPDTDEYVRIEGRQLRERDGELVLRMNNQLEEVIYFDRAKLLAVDHPAGVEVFPNERLMPAPPYPEGRIWTTEGARPPVSAVDDRGRDVLELVSRVDRRWPELELLPFKGYAREHALELDLGPDAGGQTLLLLTAWIDYADSSSNRAARFAKAPAIAPYVQVRDERGEWVTVIEQMGFPAGLPKTMTVDLTGAFLSSDRSIRIVTSMRIYWDQVLVDTSRGRAETRVTELEPLRAGLRWRGFPREYTPDGRQPKVYDYSIIEPTAPWKAHVGAYTRFGDVLELLTAVDDMYVITKNGDEIEVAFDARRLPPVREGWTRTYLLYVDGFGKDMDVNAARPDTVGPLPYHGMPSYPYPDSAPYPMDEKKAAWMETYNTRQVLAWPGSGFRPSR